MYTPSFSPTKFIHCLSLCLFLLFFTRPAFSDNTLSIDQLVQPLIKQHPEKTGLYNIEKGGEALVARGWLADRATKSIDVQYFIWANDNVGILAAESLLRAAERGVKVRVLIDDLLMETQDKFLFSLAFHPNIEIRLYNPVHSVGVNLFERISSLVVDFRGSNQRMHNKMFIVDNTVAITGGRNMENQYFDFGHEFNYRDRDVFLIGDVLTEASTTFENFWNSKLAKPVERLVKNPFESDIDWAPEDDWGDDIEVSVEEQQQQLDAVTKEHIASLHQYIHKYAKMANNYSPEVQDALKNATHKITSMAQACYWLDATFISDIPGKNNTWFNYNLGGGGNSTTALAQLVRAAKNNIIIQSPYLVLSPDAWDLFRAARARGVSIKIHTNSLASSDNLPAFGGYSAQIDDLLALGIDVFEYRPDAKRRQDLVKHYDQFEEGNYPTFSLHAKTMVVDDSFVFIGSYNLDPRSQNLNTEVGVITKDAKLAQTIKQEIETDMLPGNSWNVRTDGKNNATSLVKQSKLFLWQILPFNAIL